MPILVDAKPEEPLGQGDILRGRIVYWTKKDERPAVRDPAADYLLVLSRNCNAVRDGGILVSPVRPAQLQFTETDKETFQRLRGELEVYRDGGRSPDRVYLGNIGGTTRYAAHLDEIYVIEVPEEKVAREDFLKENRIATVDRDQLYDLHARLFLCFSRQGFDDNRWFANEDLRLLVQKGRAQIAMAEAELQDTKMNLTIAEATAPGTKGLDKKLEGMRNEVAKRKSRIDELRKAFAPLVQEAADRGLIED